MSSNNLEEKKSPDSTPAIPSAPASLEEKENTKIDTAEENDATEAPKPGYPQGWKLWLVYFATLLTMFLVGLILS
jgi:hypothetical protein